MKEMIELSIRRSKPMRVRFHALILDIGPFDVPIVNLNISTPDVFRPFVLAL
jgi:hypothetical protein